VPTYEYRCDKCGHRFEEFQKMTDKPLKKCSRCKGPVKRMIGSGGGIIFKGKGFYQTDYKKPGPKKEDKQPGGSSPGTCPKADNCPCCE